MQVSPPPRPTLLAGSREEKQLPALPYLEGLTLLVGVVVSGGLVVANGGSSCAGPATFVVNNDQDDVPGYAGSTARDYVGSADVVRGWHLSPAGTTECDYGEAASFY